MTVHDQDRLTIWKLLLLTAGFGVGLSCFQAPLDQFNWKASEDWRVLSNGILCGLSLPAIAFGLRLRLSGRRLGGGALFGLMAGLGTLLMLPPAVLYGPGSSGDRDTSIAVACMNYVMPLMALWFLLAAIVGGALRRQVWSSATPWSEKYGYLLAGGWAPLGVWAMFDIYCDKLM